MNDFVKRMIIEHKELCAKIGELNEIVYNDENPIHKATSKVDYANMAIQLNAMKTYANALECRINNQSVYIDEDGKYMQEVDLSDNKSGVKIMRKILSNITAHTLDGVKEFVSNSTSPVEKKDVDSDKDIDKQ